MGTLSSSHVFSMNNMNHAFLPVGHALNTLIKQLVIHITFMPLLYRGILQGSQLVMTIGSFSLPAAHVVHTDPMKAGWLERSLLVKISLIYPCPVCGVIKIRALSSRSNGQLQTMAVPCVLVWFLLL